jgi:F0F1-type ATP synthase assembly protein I
MNGPETTDQHNPRKPEKRPAMEIFKYAGLGMQLMGFIVVSVMIGWALDGYFATAKPWFRLGFALLGCVGAIYYSIQQFNDMNRKN